MKIVIWVVVYFMMCFLFFIGWIFVFVQYVFYNGQEYVFFLMYLFNLFFFYVVMVFYYEFFQIEIYSNVLMSLVDEFGQMICFYYVVFVLGIYSLFVFLIFVGYIIYVKWFIYNWLKGNFFLK